MFSSFELTVKDTPVRDLYIFIGVQNQFDAILAPQYLTMSAEEVDAPKVRMLNEPICGYKWITLEPVCFSAAGASGESVRRIDAEPCTLLQIHEQSTIPFLEQRENPS